MADDILLTPLQQRALIRLAWVGLRDVAVMPADESAEVQTLVDLGLASQMTVVGIRTVSITPEGRAYAEKISI